MTTSGGDFRSAFRIWFEDYLRTLTGRRVEWPQLLRTMIREEINRIREHGQPYRGNVFIDRDHLALEYAERPDQHREDLSVYRLYRLVHQENQGSCSVDREPIWLVSCKVPNQGNQRQRVADLLGVRLDGSLVVFECKAAGMRGDTPLFALLEGLDYLGHLLIDKNFDRLRKGFLEWKVKQSSQDCLSKTPQGFELVDLNPNGHHSVIVLAPSEYYAAHRRDSRDFEQGWELLSDRYWPSLPCGVRLDFAVTDYSNKPCELLPLNYAV